MDNIEIKRKLERNKKTFLNQFYVDDLGFFGSYSRGEQTESSDIDILVSFKKGHKDFFNYMRLKFFLEELLGREVDLVYKESVKPVLKNHILKQVKYV